MNIDRPEPAGASPQLPRIAAVSRTDLFFGFLKVGLLGFGGVAPWARHIIVNERRWLSERDYAALLGVGQALPGANTVNAAVMIGDKFQGVIGAMLCVCGLMALPLVILIGVATLYASFAERPLVEAAMTGAAAAAAGLIIGMALKMLRELRLAPVALVFSVSAFAAIAILGWPFVPVLAVLIPASIVAATIMDRRA